MLASITPHKREKVAGYEMGAEITQRYLHRNMIDAKEYRTRIYETWSIPMLETSAISVIGSKIHVIRCK